MQQQNQILKNKQKYRIFGIEVANPAKIPGFLDNIKLIQKRTKSILKVNHKLFHEQKFMYFKNLLKFQFNEQMWRENDPCIPILLQKWAIIRNIVMNSIIPGNKSVVHLIKRVILETLVWCSVFNSLVRDLITASNSCNESYWNLDCFLVWMTVEIIKIFQQYADNYFVPYVDNRGNVEMLNRWLCPLWISMSLWYDRVNISRTKNTFMVNCNNGKLKKVDVAAFLMKIPAKVERVCIYIYIFYLFFYLLKCEFACNIFIPKYLEISLLSNFRERFDKTWIKTRYDAENVSLDVHAITSIYVNKKYS